MKIELLYWDGCPSHPDALERLKQVLADAGVGDQVDLTEVKTEAEAVERRFPGSPTILIDGRDVDPLGAEQQQFALTCRVYRHENGRFSPLPSVAMLERAVATARR